MKPVIGIISRVEYPGETHKLIINEEYRKKIVEHGGIPLCICPCGDIDYTTTKFSEQGELTEEEKDMIIKELSFCDGILLPGGFKIYKADEFIVQYAIDNDIPLFGICLGMQTMANYKRQFWVDKNESLIDHKTDGVTHSITINKESFLYSLLKKEKLVVNSRHSYHVLPNEYFKATSVSDDNYIESIEMPGKKFVLGVQWHPESMDDETSKILFETFIDACK